MIVVAPPEAQWAVRAAQDLHGAHLLRARLYVPTLLPLLVLSGRIRAIAVDVRIAVTTLRMLDGCRGHETIRVLLVHEDTDPVTHGALRSVAWPATVAEIARWIDST
jgi:hypothetical protein